MHDRLLNIAKQEDISFQRILTLYKQEGLLHRIVSTEYEDSIVLKGGLLFYQRQGTAARPTKDIDLLGSDVDETEATLQAILTTASRVQIDDGLEFDDNSITIGRITGQTEHGGIRGSIVGYLGPARTRLRIGDRGALQRALRFSFDSRIPADFTDTHWALMDARYTWVFASTLYGRYCRRSRISREVSLTTRTPRQV